MTTPNSNSLSSPRQELIEQLSESKGLMLWSALGFLLVGTLAVVFPWATSLAVELMVGWFLVFAGVFALIGSFTVKGTGPFFGSLLLSLIQIVAGVFMLNHPAVGMVALTLLIAFSFVVDGTYQTVTSFQLKPENGWGWMLFSGMVSVVCGILVAMNIHHGSAVVIGLLLGVNFISTGISLLMVRSALK